MELVRKYFFKWKWELKALHKHADRFICVPFTSCQPTFLRRYLVNRCLCRNLIQTLRSLHCDLVYFCFLKSHSLHRGLPGLLSPGREMGDLPAGKSPLSSYKMWAWDPRQQTRTLGCDSHWGAGECQERMGFRQLCELDRAPHIVTWEPRGRWGTGLTAPEPPGGARTEGPATGSDSHPNLRELRDPG